MKLYHGSKNIVDHPTPNGSKIDNDYGPAFYLSKDLLSAHEWACRNNSVGYVNVYKFTMEGLNVLNLMDASKYSVLNWVAVLLHFRELDDGFRKAFAKRLSFLDENYYIDVTAYDVVIGWRADDAYFRFPLDFIRGNLTLSQLEESFKLGELGVQYVLMSKKAINHLTFVKSIPSENKYINAYFQNVERATRRFDELDKDEEGVRIIDIMRQ